MILWISIVCCGPFFAIIIWKNCLIDGTVCFCGMQGMVFESFNVQAGIDASGVPTDMLTLNSTVRIFFRNPSTFFGVHVTATPFQLHYYDLEVASGQVSQCLLLPFFNTVEFQLP